MQEAAVVCLSTPGADPTLDGGDALRRMLGVLTRSQDDCVAHEWQHAHFVILTRPHQSTLSLLGRMRAALDEYDEGANGEPRPHIGLHYGQVFSMAGPNENQVFRGSAMSRARAIAMVSAAGQCVATLEFRDFLIARWPQANDRLTSLPAATADRSSALFQVDIGGIAQAAQPRREAGESAPAASSIRALRDETVTTIGALLADHIGPVAIALSEEAARASKQPDAFVALLAVEIPAGAARHQFIADARALIAQAVPPAAGDMRPLGNRTVRAISALLADEIGPVAAALAEEAARMSRQPDAFIALLAEEIPTPEERSRFVAAAKLLIRGR